MIADLGPYDFDGVRTVVYTVSDIVELRDAVPVGAAVSCLLSPLSAVTAASYQRLAKLIAESKPTFVHAFGDDAEMFHREVDRALESIGTFAMTAQTRTLDIGEVIFEIFRVDLPEEDDFDRRRHRAIVVDNMLGQPYTCDFLRAAKNIDETIQEVLSRERPR